MENEPKWLAIIIFLAPCTASIILSSHYLARLTFRLPFSFIFWHIVNHIFMILIEKREQRRKQRERKMNSENEKIIVEFLGHINENEETERFIVIIEWRWNGDVQCNCCFATLSVCCFSMSESNTEHLIARRCECSDMNVGDYFMLLIFSLLSPSNFHCTPSEKSPVYHKMMTIKKWEDDFATSRRRLSVADAVAAVLFFLPFIGDVSGSLQLVSCVASLHRRSCISLGSSIVLKVSRIVIWGSTLEFREQEQLLLYLAGCGNVQWKFI